MASSDIRLATTADVVALLDCWVELVESQRPYGTQLLADENREIAEQWTVELVVQQQIVVAEINNTIIGFVSFEPKKDRFKRAISAGIIHNLYVRERYRDQGIGSRLLVRAEEELSQLGVDQIRLEILQENEAAEAFYRNRSYQPHRIAFTKAATETDTHNTLDKES